jgi:Flp pilus assembly protein TadG
MQTNKPTTAITKALKYLIKCQRGVVAIEMAFIGPFMLLLYFGLLDMTNFMTENRKTIAIAGSVADLVGQHRRSILKAEVADYLKIGNMIMKPDTDGDVRIVITNYRKSGLTANAVWSRNNGKGLPCVNAIPATEIVKLMELNNDVVVTQVCTKIRLYSGKLLTLYKPDKSDFDVENFVMVRPRVALTLECYAASATVTGASNC